jgi:hypothetical protein
MKTKLFLILVFSTILIANGQGVQYANSKGVQFSFLPSNYWTGDTTVLLKDSITHSHTLVGSNTNSNVLDSIRGSRNGWPYYSSYLVEVAITNHSQFIGTFIIDTNNVFADSININLFSAGLKRSFLLNYDTKIRFRHANSNNVGTIDFNLTTVHKIEQIYIETNLPSMDTMFLDRTGSIFSSLPIGYMPYDTLTKKMDSMVITRWCTTANGYPSSCSFNFNVSFPYQKFYCEIILFSPWSIGSRQYVDTNGVRYKYIPNRNFTPVIGWYYFSDTLVMDSTTVFDIGMAGGNGDAMAMDFEAFVTQTQILISNTVGLENQKPSQASIKLFPNPATEVIFLEGANATQEQYQIFNISGMLVSEGTVQGNEIPIHSLTNGIYFISFPKLGIREKIIKN